ncbi:helix-turn-helix transcriptional regulator [Streptomyces sp. NPDC003077]|uniref:helix-turn-helix domain-containing protein n=1 Tax=Streptomyces sp. NPDC003077 TaxID=3154443 RepID=UPI0033A6CEE3
MSTVLGRRLGGELLRMREARGLRQAAAAEALTASVPKVAKIERGLVPVRDPDVRALCHLYEVTDPDTVAGLLHMAKLDRERRKAKGWWKQYPEKADIAEYIGMEDVAVRVRSWQLSLVPGLLQTPDYTAALGGGQAIGMDADLIKQSVEIKQNRQARLSGDKPLSLWAVVWEPALRQQVGGCAVMSEQLRHLLEMADKPNVRLQVLPLSAGAFPGMPGAFSIVSFAESDAIDVVYADSTSGTVWLESEAQAALHGELFDGTVHLALSERSSVDLIHRIREET